MIGHWYPVIVTYLALHFDISREEVIRKYSNTLGNHIDENDNELTIIFKSFTSTHELYSILFILISIGVTKPIYVYTPDNYKTRLVDMFGEYPSISEDDKYPVAGKLGPISMVSFLKTFKVKDLNGFERLVYKIQKKHWKSFSRIMLDSNFGVDDIEYRSIVLKRCSEINISDFESEDIKL